MRTKRTQLLIKINLMMKQNANYFTKFACVALAMLLSWGVYAQEIMQTVKEVPSFQLPKLGDVLFSQMDPCSGSMFASQEFTGADSLKTCFDADDFVVPEGDNWEISTVGALGYYWAGSAGDFDRINLFFYADDNGMPGDLLHDFSGIGDFYNEVIPAGETSMTNLEIELPEAITLEAGHYWLSIQMVGQYAVNGQWGWATQLKDPHDNCRFHWKCPQDGFQNGFVDWTEGPMLWPFGYWDNCFAFYGPAYEKDLSLKSILSPITASDLNTAETVTIKLRNEGAVSQSDFEVQYVVNGGDAVVETINETLEAGAFMEYSFVSTVDMSVPGPYTIEVAVNLTGDEVPENNVQSTEVYNLGEVFVMQYDQTITTCGATFTDPGGLDGNFLQDDMGKTTIYPAEAGKMARLSFIDFDISWSDFIIYDGTDTLAPVIGQWVDKEHPGVVTAMNESGALTIFFKGPGWADAPGWSAFISCYETPEDNFAVTAFDRSTFSFFTETDFTLTAQLRNIGTLTQSKDVIFYMGDVELGSVNTGDVAYKDYVTVELTTNVDFTGAQILRVEIPTDEGDDPQDNFATMDVQVYEKGSFVEHFEDASFPPDFWSTDAWSANNGVASAMTGAGMHDTLVSPQLNIEQGDLLSIMAWHSPWWVGGMDIYWIDAESGEYHHIADVEVSMNHDNFVYDLSEAAGHNYVAFVSKFDGFWGSGQVFLDDVIGIGVELYFVDDDMTAFDFSGDLTPAVEEETSFDVMVRNIGAMDREQGSYTVKLMQEGENGPVMLTSMEGNALESMEAQLYQIPYTFPESGIVNVYAEVEFAGDMVPENNTTTSFTVYVQVAGTQQNEVGDGDQMQYQSPIDTRPGYSMSQNIYTDEFITDEGAITGISFYYKNTDLNPVENIPVQIWIANTEQAAVGFEWTPSTEMTEVFNDTLEFAVGSHECHIPFSVPFEYNGGNVQLLVFKNETQDWQGIVEFYHTMVSDTLTKYVKSYEVIDPANPYGLQDQKLTSVPNATFFVNTSGNGEVTGTINDEQGQPLADANVGLDGFTINTTTDADGHYVFTGILAGEQSFTASKFGYEDLTQPLEVIAGLNNTLDFQLTAKPQVQLVGQVNGNDNPSLMFEGAEITLEGYENYAAATSATGEFVIDGIYGNETYNLTITYPQFATYTAELTFEAEGLDLGTITLSELMNIPISVMADEDYFQVDISWENPVAAVDTILTLDDGVADNCFTAEMYEDVWMGNHYNVTEPITITSFDVYFLKYDYNVENGPVTIDLFDAESNRMLVSDVFMTQHDDWVHIDIPAMTVNGEFYAMIHWNSLPELTDFLAIDVKEGAAGAARIKYPNQEIEPLTNYVADGGYFLIHANGYAADGKGERSVEGYNIFRGTRDDMNNVSGWAALNNNLVSGRTFTDQNWPPAELDTYVYAVEAIYTTGESPVSFSSAITFDNVAPLFASWPVTVGIEGFVYTYEIEVEDNDLEVVSITAEELPEWLTFTDMGNGQALLTGIVPETGDYDVELLASDGQMSSEQNFTITVETGVGIGEGEETAIRAYPVPAHENLYLENVPTGAEITLYDVYGNQVLTQTATDQHVVLNLPAGAAGNYMLSIRNNATVLSKKITVLP